MESRNYIAMDFSGVKILRIWSHNRYQMVNLCLMLVNELIDQSIYALINANEKKDKIERNQNYIILYPKRKYDWLDLLMNWVDYSNSYMTYEPN